MPKYAVCHKSSTKPTFQRFDSAEEAFEFIHPKNREVFDVVEVIPGPESYHRMTRETTGARS